MHDIVIVSDLHLGRGKNHFTGRYYRLEAFFYDNDFHRFCDWLCTDARHRKTSVKLILNGDTFDLLRIEPERGAGNTLRERRFGPTMTPSTATTTMADILHGHPRFVEALASVLTAGHHVIFLPGNHDPEIQWPCVQEVVRNAIVERLGDNATASTRLEFRPWFYYEPGRIWIEHGNQYDTENSFEYPLRTNTQDLPDTVHRAEIDVPVGTFFQRYLYNGFGNITFIVPSGRANARYVRWLMMHKPRLLARIATKHVPFFFQVLRRIAKSTASAEPLRHAHRKTLERLATETSLGTNLEQIDELKRVRGNAAMVTRALTTQIVKVAGVTLIATLLVVALWFAGFHAISQMRAGFGLKATLFLALNLLFLGACVIALGYFLLRPGRAPPQRPMRRAAQKIVDILDVPLVTFGHTHDEIVWRLRHAEKPCWYYNTGTWVAVFTHDELLPRERVQYTFLRVIGDKPELLHFSPGRAEAVPVILIEDDHLRVDPAKAPDAQAS